MFDYWRLLPSKNKQTKIVSSRNEIDPNKPKIWKRQYKTQCEKSGLDLWNYIKYLNTADYLPNKKRIQ